MVIETPSSHWSKTFDSVLAVVLVLSLSTFGCGPSEEATEDEWETTPPVSPTAQLEYRIDSLMNENRILKQQVDAMSTENRSLTARAAELEMRLNEQIAVAQQPPTPPPPAPGTNVSSGYDGALQEFRQRNYEQAALQFEGLLNSGIQEDLQDNCHYWVGESMYARKKYDEAVREFQLVIDFVKSEKKDDAQFMIGNCYLAMGDRAGAKDAYAKVVSGYPTSDLLQKAQDRLTRLQ